MRILRSASFPGYNLGTRQGSDHNRRLAVWSTALVCCLMALAGPLGAATLAPPSLSAPEPAILTLAGVGLIALGVFGRWRRPQLRPTAVKHPPFSGPIRQIHSNTKATKYAGLLILPLLLLLGARSARADSVLGSFTANRSYGGAASFFQGTFLVQDSIGNCDPEICNNLLPILNASVPPSATAPDTFVIDAANNPDWTAITSLLQNNNSFFKVCEGFTPTCSSFFAETVGALFFPNGGSFASDSINSISVTLNPLTFSITPTFDTITYTETLSV